MKNISTLNSNKQNADTAINTSNIASQSVNYANSAGSAVDQTDRDTANNAVNLANSKRMKQLWAGSQATGTFSLNKSIANFDFLIVQFGYVGSGTIDTQIVAPYQSSWRLNIKYDFNYYASGSGYCKGYYSNYTTIIVESNPVDIRTIYGVKV